MKCFFIAKTFFIACSCWVAIEYLGFAQNQVWAEEESSMEGSKESSGMMSAEQSMGMEETAPPKKTHKPHHKHCHGGKVWNHAKGKCVSKEEMKHARKTASEESVME